MGQFKVNLRLLAAFRVIANFLSHAAAWDTGRQLIGTNGPCRKNRFCGLRRFSDRLILIRFPLDDDGVQTGRPPAAVVLQQRHRVMSWVRGAWIACIVLCLCGRSASVRADAAAETRPNIVFIFADDHAAHAMSCYGSRINKTPNLDRIATAGMLFHNCFCTNSICGPSRAVVLTGKHSHKNGFKRNGDRFDGSQPTFPKMLRGGLPDGDLRQMAPGQRADRFRRLEILIGLGTYYNPVLIENGKHVPHTGYVTDLVTDLALDYLKHGRDPHKPFCSCITTGRCTRVRSRVLKHLHLYDDVTIPEPDNLFDDYQGRGTAAHVQQMEVVRDLKAARLRSSCRPRS